MRPSDWIARDLRRRIQQDKDFFGGSLPDRFTIAWRGYLTGLNDWKLLTDEDYHSLMITLPSVEAVPTRAVGRRGE